MIRWDRAAPLVAALGLLLPSSSGSAVAVLHRHPMTDDTSREELFQLKLSPSKRSSDQNYQLYLNFEFPRDAAYDNRILHTPRTGELFGIDASHYNQDSCKCLPGCRIDWASLASQQVYFVYLKATQGADGYDCRFYENWDALKALPQASRPRAGAYHFLSSLTGGGAQAHNFLDYVKGRVGADDLPPVMDLEWDVRSGDKAKHDRWLDVPKDRRIQIALDWLGAVERATHRKPIIYTAQHWWDPMVRGGAKYDALAAYPLWVASATQDPLPKEVAPAPKGVVAGLWQFTNRASFSMGTAGHFDASMFKGTPEAFAREFGSTTR